MRPTNFDKAANKSLSIRLPEEANERLNFLAKKTGRTKSFYITQAVLEHLEDMEDLYLAEQAYHDFKESGEKTVTLAELEKELDLGN